MDRIDIDRLKKSKKSIRILLDVLEERLGMNKGTKRFYINHFAKSINYIFITIALSSLGTLIGMCFLPYMIYIFIITFAVIIIFTIAYEKFQDIALKYHYWYTMVEDYDRKKLEESYKIFKAIYELL